GDGPADGCPAASPSGPTGGVRTGPDRLLRPPRKRGYRDRLFHGQPDTGYPGRWASFLHPPPPAGGRGASLPLLPGRRGGHRRGDLQLPVHGGDDPREKGATGGGPAGGTGGERVAKGKDSGPLIQGRRDVGFMPVGRGAPPGE